MCCNYGNYSILQDNTTYFEAVMEASSVIVDCVELSTVADTITDKTAVDDAYGKPHMKHQKHDKLTALIELLKLLTETMTSAAYRENKVKN